ncbi:hypothetical protein [Bartonella sp. cb54]|uniref:hypothetical protein n=1 Tax=Bartonella sp. cb54 TaxID=3385560 RepID=UPI0039A403BA
MSTKSHIINQVSHDKFSSFAVKQKKAVNARAAMTMSDIATNLRSVHAQMQMKSSPHHLISSDPVEDSFKSYLDDISRAILAEHSMRSKREKELFEHLGQIKILIQNLHSDLRSEKKSSQETAMTTRRVSRSKSLDSIVHHLAHMESQASFSCQEAPSFSEQKTMDQTQTNVGNAFQQGGGSSLPTDVMKPPLKEAEGLIVHSTSNIQISGGCVEDSQCDSSLKAEPLKERFFLRYPVKKLLICFLIIAFIVAITLCSYSFLRGARFFNL